MYSTCLYCHARLGANDAIEHFPVGRRLAFDAAKGRLWVVCAACGRWNLTPLEERWEAVEECERLFRDARLRVSTDNVGLARVREGMELVRVGRPLRPEMAAWRYGREFLRRRMRYALPATGLAAASMLGMYAIGIVNPALTLAVVAVGAAGAGTVTALRTGVGRVRIAVDDRTVLRLSGGQVRKSRIVGDAGNGWAIRVPSWGDEHALTGGVGRRAIGSMLARVNREGGRPEEIGRSIAYVERVASVEGYLARIATQAGWKGLTLDALPRDVALGLEMATQEQMERRAMEGELAALAREWQLAEEIAAIADGLLVPAPVDATLAAAREGRPS